jgi:hypothetical protein
MLLLIILFVLFFGGGSYFYGQPGDGGRSYPFRGATFPGVGLIVLIVLLLAAFGVLHF